MNRSKMLQVIIPIQAGCCFLGALVFGIATASFLSKAESTTGTITAVANQLSESGSSLAKPTFTFTVDQTTHSVTPNSFVSPSPGRVGDNVPILYDPSQPQNARINAFVYTWATPVVLILLGFVLTLIHFILRFVIRNFFGTTA